MSLICPVPVTKEEDLCRILPQNGQKEESFPPLRAYKEDMCPLKHGSMA
jgi:hypothetical protein